MSACELRYRIECSSSIDAQQILPTMTNNIPQKAINVTYNSDTNNVVSDIQNYVNSLGLKSSS